MALDSCIASIFEPGNIATDSGAITIPRYAIQATIIETASAAANVSAGFSITGAVSEAASAADLVSSSVSVAGTVAETATASSTQDATVVSGVAYATWESASVAAVTLSGGNLVATNTGTTSANQGAHVASTSGKTSGKYYFEVTWTTITSGIGSNNSIGVGTTASTYTNMGNGGTTGIVNYVGNSVYSNGANLGTMGSPWTAGQVVGIAVDLDNRKIWFCNSPSGNWNSNATYNPATNVGGLTIPAGTMVPFITFGGTGGAASNVMTANFGAAAFSGAVPSGFTPGWTA
jgi:SPRY domain